MLFSNASSVNAFGVLLCQAFLLLKHAEALEPTLSDVSIKNELIKS